VAVSLRQTVAVGSYVLKQRLAGRQRYPLVLMLEPLFRCNLTCFGCGKIDYPDAILNKRLSVQECLDAVDECGAPMVAIPGGEPLIHKEIGEIVKGIVARKKFVSLCTNALLLEKKLHVFEPSPYLFFSVHLDGLKEHHDKSVCMEGGFEKAVSAIKAAKTKELSAMLWPDKKVDSVLLIVHGHKDEGARELRLAGRNLRRADVVFHDGISAHAILGHDRVVVSHHALDAIAEVCRG